MTFPQHLVLSNEGKLPRPRRRRFSSPSEVAAWLNRTAANKLHPGKSE